MSNYVIADQKIIKLEASITTVLLTYDNNVLSARWFSCFPKLNIEEYWIVILINMT